VAICSAVSCQISAYQIQQADATVFVCKDPTDEKHLMGETFHQTAHRLLIRPFQLTTPYKVSFYHILVASGHQAIVLQCANKVLAFLQDELEVLLHGKPAVRQYNMA